MYEKLLHRQGSEQLFHGRKKERIERFAPRAVIACMLPEGERRDTWLIDSHKALGLFSRYRYTGRKLDF